MGKITRNLLVDIERKQERVITPTVKALEKYKKRENSPIGTPPFASE